MPPELLTFLTAMVPVGELRAAVPLGILQFNLPWPLVYVLSVLGNIAPIPVLLYGLFVVGGRIEPMDNAVGATLRWRTKQIEERWGAIVRRYGVAGVTLIVAIPLPFTGAWTGALAVWALHVPVRRGFAAIAAGVLIAGAVVTALTLAGIELFKLFG